MLINIPIVRIVVVLSLLHEAIPDRTSPIIIQSFSFPPGSDLLVSQNTKNDSLLYAECIFPPQNDRTRHCSVSIQSNSLNIDKSCNVTLTVSSGRTKIHNRVTLRQLSSKTALLIWLEINARRNDAYESAKYWIKISIVHLDECRTSQAEIPVNASKTDPEKFLTTITTVAYDDESFDVLYSDWKLCKLTFDTEGRNVRGPIAWLDQHALATYPVPVEAQSAVNGHVVFLKNGSLNLVKDNESQQMTKFSKVEQDHIVNYSNEHNLITFCVHDQTVELSNCTQFDTTGVKKFDVKLPLNLQDYLPYGLHNLPNGGFLLLTLKCRPDEPCPNARHYVRKISADGKTIGERMEIAGYECKLDSASDRTRSSLFINGAGQQCLMLACLEKADSNLGADGTKFSAARKCYSNKDFLY